MKLLMATCADENLKDYTPYTLPVHQMYAKKWGCDFKVLDDPAYSDWGLWCYRTLCFYELFKEYDRIIYADADIIINKNCPNPFEVVPHDTVGAVMEDKGSRRKERLARIKQVQHYLDDIGWTEGFFNMGFYVVSRCHREMFQPYKGKIWKDRGWDSPFYTFQIMRLGYSWMELGFRFNHMSMFSEKWNGSPSRFDSYILHYAGNADFPDKGKRSREELIIDDVKKIYGEDKRFGFS